MTLISSRRDALGNVLRDDLLARLREAVRTQGVDPQNDPERVRALARDVVLDHDRRSLNGAHPPVGDADLVVEELVSAVCGYGPLQRYLEDDEIEEIWINDPRLVR